MKVVIQRVSEATCTISSETTARIEEGLCLFVSFAKGDTEALLAPMARKISHLRIFEDKQGKMNLSVKDIKGEILSISQFTLEANTKKGHRPSFTDALEPKEAKRLYDTFNAYLADEGCSVQTGSFQEHMLISIQNDGPVTILLSS